MSEASPSRSAALSPSAPSIKAPRFSSLWSWLGALSVFTVGLAVSVYAYFFTAEQLENALRSRFDARAVVALAQIDKRLNDYRNVILGLQGLFIASEKVAAKEFHNYTENLKLKQRLPGLQAISFQRYLRQSQKAGFVAAMRRERGMSGHGYADFDIHPEGDREEYVVVTYLETTDDNYKALGVDVQAQPISREPIQRSRDTGQISLSAPFTIPQLGDKLPRLVLRAPVYRNGAVVDTLEQRRAALEGFVVMVIEADSSFREFFGTLVSEGERTVIEDAGSEVDAVDAPRTLVFDSGAPAVLEASRLSKHATLSIGGRRWDIQVLSNDVWLRQLPARNMPELILATGALFSLLLASLYLALARSKARANRLARDMTRDLRDSEQRLRALAELSSDWFWETDIEDRFTHMGGDATKRLGFPEGDIIGKTRWEIEPATFTPEQRAAHRRQIAARQPFEVEYELSDSAGEPKWLVVRGAPRYDDDGDFVGYHGTAQDITEKKRGDAEIARKSAVLEATFNHMGQGISVVDGDLRLIAHNPRFRQLLALPESLVRDGTMMEDIVRFNAARNEYGPGDKEAQVRVRLEQARRFAPHFFKLVRPDGKVLELNGHPIPGGGFVTTYTDVTEREKADEQVRYEHDFRQKLIESIPGLFYLLDTSRRMLFWNHNFEIVSGYSADEIAQMNALDFFDTEHRLLIQKAIETVFSSGEATADAPILTKTGARIPHYFTGLRIAHEGQFTLIGIAIDVSEEKKAQQMIRDINETLEQRVRERTAELEASNQELEAFSYSVSHDLRAPLRAMDGFSHLLDEDYAEQLGPEGRSHIKRIRAASQRMGKLIDDLLDLARVSRQELNRSRIDLSELANEIRLELYEQAPDRKVTWLISEGLSVNADPVQIKLVLENLLRNAWKFSLEREEARIDFGCLTGETEPTFYVRDNGAGFEMTYIDKLFKPFQRLHALKRFDGTGIGLAIVQRILRRHGGRIWAESAPDAGATFYFTLP